MDSILINKWLDQFENRQPIFNHIFLFIIAAAFVVSDWMYGAFTFTELIMGMALLVLILSGKYRIHIHQFKWILAPIIIISLHTVYLFNVQEDFALRVSVIALIKLSYFLFLIVGIYNYVRVQKLEKEFLIWNNLMAMIILAIGSYIAIAVYTEINFDQNLPYEFLLKFTRLDGHLYRKDIPIVRMKSIFQEPAHLGYYLNSILMVNLLNKNHIKITRWISTFLVIGVVLTLSYSSVFIMLAILCFWLLRNGNLLKGKIQWSSSIFFSLILIFFVIFLFRGLIYTTLIQRTIEIATGTESSGYERLIISWRYINKETYLFGYGFLQSPGMLWNVFAYVFTELGLIVFTLYILNIGYLMRFNIPIALVFILMNFAKGGYLSSSYWFLILLVIIYSGQHYESVYLFRRKEEQLEK
ncbi:hypothetical protein ACEN4K_10560 [Marinilactibacillus psychrotolerans]|uniref:hypothetical protein n=1 Tax=Marinilactibacillus psychrotolerans TaxID=191770 RepID=UPI0038897579